MPTSRSRRALALATVGLLAACAGTTDTTPRVTGATLPSGTVGSAYHFALTATGAGSLEWLLTGGALPTGLTLSSGGVIDGTPTTAGAFAFAVEVSNGQGADTANYAITIAEPLVAPTITSALPLADATVGVAWSTSFTATGTTPIAWSISAGTLPSGLSLDAATGVLAGTPAAAATATFTVAADNVAGTDTQTCVLTVLAVPTAPTITGPSSPLTNGIVNVAYAVTLLASGTAPITWAVTAGALPTGLSLDAGTGVLSGTPTLAETQTFTVTATNGLGSDSASFQLATGYAPSLTALTPASGVVGGTIRLDGSGFATSTLGNTVHFGAHAATVLSATSTALEVQVPAGVGSTESVAVTTSTATTSAVTFTLDTTSVVFVNVAATGAADGSCWTDAFPTLQGALAVATSSQEIWIAAGTYKPGAPTSNTFAVASQNLYGGFAGAEALRSQRDWIGNATELSGDANGDSVGLTNESDNNQHVVVATGTSTLDGLGIAHGNSNNSGGGIHASAGVIALRHLDVHDNRAAGDGAGIFAADVILAISDCTIRDNVAAASGGGLAVEHSSSASFGSLARVALARNSAAFHGGGVYDTESVGYVDCVFTGNHAGFHGGGIYHISSAISVNFATFTANTADAGGAFFGRGTVTNGLFWANTATTSGDDVEQYGDLTLDHCLLATAVAGSGNLTTQALQTGDPLFFNAADPDGADDRFRTADDGLRLDAGSPAVDAGTVLFVFEDILGAARTVGAGADIGAYERQ